MPIFCQPAADYAAAAYCHAAMPPLIFFAADAAMPLMFRFSYAGRHRHDTSTTRNVNSHAFSLLLLAAMMLLLRDSR